MFYIKDLDLETIRNRARDQLLSGTFPSFSGCPDYDDFIRSVIEEEAKIILGIASVEKLEEVHDYKSKSSEFLVELLEILDISFVDVINMIQDFIKNQEESEDSIIITGRVRRARKFYQALQAPWFETIMEPGRYQELLKTLKTLGKL